MIRFAASRHGTCARDRGNKRYASRRATANRVIAPRFHRMRLLSFWRVAESLGTCHDDFHPYSRAQQHWFQYACRGLRLPFGWPTCATRAVVDEVQTNSALLEEVPSMGFDRLRPLLAAHGLSEEGTLAELRERLTSALEGCVKASAEGGRLSRFGEAAARMIFRRADKVGERTRFRHSAGKRAQLRSFRLRRPKFALTRDEPHLGELRARYATSK